jgi:hypothetical protein
VGEEETSEVEELGLVDEGLDLGGSEMLRGEGLGGSEGGGQGSTRREQEYITNRAVTLASSPTEEIGRNEPVVSGDDDGASSGLLALEDLVGGLNSLLYNYRPAQGGSSQRDRA